MIPENKVVQTSGSDHPTHHWHTQVEKHRSVGFRMIAAVSKAVSFVFYLLHVCKWLLRVFPRPGQTEWGRGRERERERERKGERERASTEPINVNLRFFKERKRK